MNKDATAQFIESHARTLELFVGQTEGFAAEPNIMTTTEQIKLDTTDTRLEQLAAIPNLASNADARALLKELAELRKASPSQTPVFSLSEAESYSGLSRTALLIAIEARRLPAHKPKDAWQIHRADLEKLIYGVDFDTLNGMMNSKDAAL